MVKGVKGARRRLGCGASGRSGGLTGEGRKLSNKQRSIQAAKAPKKSGPERTVREEDRKAIEAANPSDARGLLNLLIAPKANGKGVGLKGEVQKRKRENEGGAGGNEPKRQRRQTVLVDVEPRPPVEAPPAPADAAEAEAVEPAAAPTYAAWEELGVAPDLLEELKAHSFHTPTPVQQQTFADTLTFERDVLAAAQTGSGKTLAFGLPIIQRIKEKIAASPVAWEHRVIDCLVITPTRELAMQVYKHINPFATRAGLSAACIVGGMSDEKQLRLLNRSKKHRPHILIATPGRLWGLLEEGDSDYLNRSITRALDYLVVDEADKMIQSKHFDEMGSILDRIRTMPAGKIQGASSTARQTKAEYTIVQRAPEDAAARAATGDFSTNEVECFDSVEDFLRVFQEEAKHSPYSGTQIEGMNYKEMAKELNVAGGDGGDEDAGEDEEMEEAEELEEMEEGEESPEVDEAEEELPEMEEVEEDEEAEKAEEVADDANPEKEPEPYKIPTPARLKTYITSATLTLDMKFHEGARGGKSFARHSDKASKEQYASDGKIVKTKKPEENKDMVSAILAAFGLEAKACRIVDVTSKSLLVDTLTESVMTCLDGEKELATYAFLLANKGRTLVFVNAISTLRRLVSILTQLGIKVYALHSEMQQRQRLKNLDRLKADPECVVIATDVAARGLDIKNISHVVHYQFPRNTDTYVHRCGRTARANASGFSLALVSPEEKQLYNQTCSSLGKEQGLQNYQVDPEALAALRERLSLAKQLDKALNQSNKVHSYNTWLEKNASDMGMILDENLKDKRLDEEQGGRKHRQNVARLQAKLAAALAEPVSKQKGAFRHSVQRRANTEVAGGVAAKMRKLVKKA